MKTIITMILLLLAGSATASEQLIDVQHDSVRGVTCWILNNTGISCLPDSSLLQAPTSSTSDESQGARASLANIEAEKGRFSTTPLPQKKGFQL
ncbi:hypothetical protein [Pseudomonas chlororaphis]|uniref:hypothetical protein n=1 Tax=Pseudomonas chlororaphis TaxID=587753 RepID=UPI001B30E93A|nr:hypothetical protein [Pseudomonas chlororaphis]MBP5058512.1 hypothetical protein [Pseudomonas chlororaphis]MBP5137395.1 hypothetical protein [Pseudomonas chlororaphis]QTT99271.1 hypothetical protein HUT26_08305 [Pseudomonas chlororaphis]